MLRDDQRGMIMSGIALLLVLPAMLISATFLTIVHTGGEATSIERLSDRAAYTAYNMKNSIRDLKESGERLDSEVLDQIAEKYSQNTIFENIQLHVRPFDIWTEIHYLGDVYTHHATSKFCEVKNLGVNRWYYNFEDLRPEDWEGADKDFNEPLLRLEKLDNEDWRVTVEPTYSGGATATVHWGDKVIFWNVNSDDNEPGDGTPGVGDGRWEGESKIVSGVPSSIEASISLEDPGGTVVYEENFLIG